MTSTSESSTSAMQANASEGDILQQALKNIGLSQSKEQTHVLKDGKCYGLPGASVLIVSRVFI